jgi:hypothetical protein
MVAARGLVHLPYHRSSCEGRKGSDGDDQSGGGKGQGGEGGASLAGRDYLLCYQMGSVIRCSM